MRRSLPAALALAAAITTLQGQPPPAKMGADAVTLGPKVGQRVPDFRLTDQHGATRDLKSVLGPKGAMLVFFRSADW